MKYFDTHIHFFPDKLAGKALPKLREISKCKTYRITSMLKALTIPGIT